MQLNTKQVGYVELVVFVLQLTTKKQIQNMYFIDCKCQELLVGL